MVGDTERMVRAGRYVLGRMSDREREQAERDLEHDDRFREAVVAVAERMRHFGGGSTGAAEVDAAEAMWTSLAARLGALPQMRGAGLGGLGPSLVGSASGERTDAPRETVMGGAVARLLAWRAGLGRLAGAARNRFRRSGSPVAAAVLETPLIGPCAVVEVLAGGRLRLLLLGEWALGPKEQLSLWGVREDGAAERIGSFKQSGQIRLAVPSDARHSGYQLGRESPPFLPAGRMNGIPLAEGAVKPLAGSAGLKQASPAPGRLSASRN